MLTITRSLARDLVQDSASLEHRITRFLNDAFGGADGQTGDGAAAAWVPAVDVFEDANAIRIVAEVPGVSPDDVKISHENNVLTIHGSKQQAAQERTDRCPRRALYGAFHELTLPATVAPRYQCPYEPGPTVPLPRSSRRGAQIIATKYRAALDPYFVRLCAASRAAAAGPRGHANRMQHGPALPLPYAIYLTGDFLFITAKSHPASPHHFAAAVVITVPAWI